jgi:hypothetical protein
VLGFINGIAFLIPGTHFGIDTPDSNDAIHHAMDSVVFCPSRAIFLHNFMCKFNYGTLYQNEND